MGSIIREKVSRIDEDAWYKYRDKYVNASEVAVVLGQSEYQVAADLLLKKSGWRDHFREGNKYTVYGNLLEDAIAEGWAYYDYADPSAYIANYKNNHKIRKCERKNGSLRNTDFPWLSASLDRVIKKGNVNLINGDILEVDCPLELKTIDKYVMNKWKSGVPNPYLLQLTTQMMVTGTYYGEIFMMSSDREFHLYPVDYRESLGESILEKTEAFHKLVAKVSTYKEMYDEAMLHGKNMEAQKIEHEVLELCPLPGPGQEELYREFLTEQYNKPESETDMIGTEEDLIMAREMLYLDDYASHIKDLLEGKKNIARYKMGNRGLMRFEGTKFMLTWKADKNGKRSFKFSSPELVDTKNDLIAYCEQKKISIQSTF